MRSWIFFSYRIQTQKADRILASSRYCVVFHSGKKRYSLCQKKKYNYSILCDQSNTNLTKFIINRMSFLSLNKFIISCCYFINLMLYMVLYYRNRYFIHRCYVWYYITVACKLVLCCK
jgi:hypothetical protein